MMTCLLKLEALGLLERLLPNMSIIEGIIPPAMVSRDWVRQSRGVASPKRKSLAMDTHLQCCL